MRLMSTMADPTIPLAAMTDQGWRPGIGDPSLMGWLTVLAYASVAALCGWAGWRERVIARWARGRVWAVLVVGMAGLGVNKQLDLQTWFGRSAKSVVQAAGWMTHERLLETGFIVALVVLALLTIGMLLFWLRRYWRQYGLAVVGIAFLAAFVIARGSSFHDVDWILGESLAGASVNGMLELGGIGLIAVNAAVAVWVNRDARGSR